MRALRVVGITEGGGECSVVLEDSQHRERFTVPADEQLRAAARGDLTRLGQIAIELESQLRPREIQARIRAGASVEQVAAAAGVPMAKIERFAYPVLLERSRTAEVAQRAHPLRADGPDRRILADVVSYTFGLRGQEYQTAEWDSWKGEDGRWVVALSWRAGRSDNRALWAFQPGAHGGTVTAIDEHAHDLVEGLPARPLRTVGPVIEMSRPDELPPASGPEEGHELRAAASDIAARRDLGDWSRPVAEPRRPEPRRAADRPRTDPADVPPRSGRVDEPHLRSGAPRPGRVDERTETREDGPRADTAPAPSPEPATEWPTSFPPDPGAVTSSAPTASGREGVSSAPAVGRADGGVPSPVVPEAARPGTAVSEPAPPETAAPETTPSSAVSTDAAAPEGAAPVTPSAPAAAAAPETAPADSASPETLSPDAAAPETAVPDTAAPETATPAPKRTRKGKPVMPSWDEVLLGVRSQR